MMLDEFKGKLAAEHTGQFRLDNAGNIRHKTLKTILDRPACPLAVIFGSAYYDGAHKAGMLQENQLAITHAADGGSSKLRRWMLATLCGETT